MNKICTSIEQSKKLIELGINIKTADMYWWYSGNRYCVESMDDDDFNENSDIPAWSLSALIKVLPADYIAHKHYFLEISKMGDNAKPYEVRYFRFREQSDGANFGRIIHISYTADNLVDACVEMIVKLNELKIL